MGDAITKARDWRAGRPEEDPEKTKRWGFITAKPSEYLVHCRRGRVLERSSGQGASCFKWPRDAVAVVPTSLQRVSFTADQVTLEKVGVKVTGLAVYRIAEPLTAYRVLNFSFPERAQEKLEQTMVSMLVGATRRLVANLAVEDAIRKRKDALAAELLREIAPVLGGSGRVDDTTDRGWGVVVDTIEIQEVRVASEAVFAAMQAPYRASLDRQAREARAESDKASSLAEARAEREVEETRIEAEAAVESRRSEMERERAERRTRDAVRAEELAVTEAEARLRAHPALMRALEAHTERRRAEHALGHEERRTEAAVAREVGLSEAEVELMKARAEQERAEAEARVTLAENLPALAEAVGQKFGEVRVTQIGAGGDPFGSITQAVRSVLELARSSGLTDDPQRNAS